MTLIDILEACAAMVATTGVILGGIWAATRIILKIYDHVRDVEKLKRDSLAFRKSERSVNQKTYSMVTQNRKAIAHVEKVLRYVLKTQALTKREIIKVGRKLNAVEQESEQNED